MNEEIRDLFVAGAYVVQIDEPYMQARPEQARDFGVEVVDRALDDVVGETALHICFGYAAIIHGDRPKGYNFLPELVACAVHQVSVETAQPRLDPAELASMRDKRIMVDVVDLNDPAVETPEIVADRIRCAMTQVPVERIMAAPD